MSAPTAPPGQDGSLLVLRLAAALGGGLAVFVAFQVALLLLWHAWPDSLRHALAVSQAVVLGGGALALLIGARASGILPPPPPAQGVQPAALVGYVTWTSALTYACIGVLMGTLALADPELLRRLLSFGQEMYGPLLTVHGPWDVLEVLLVASVVPAVFEELLFRGTVQRLLGGSMPRWAAVAVTAAFFSLVHLEALGLLPRFFLGVALGLLYERTGSLLLPMLLHAAHNLVALSAFSWEAGVVVPSPAQAGVLIAACIPGGVLLAFLWLRALRALPRA